MAAPFTPLLDEAWVVAVATQIEALPTTDADVMDAYTVGIFDAEQGAPCEPLKHYAKLGEIEQYISGWQDATETLEAAADLTESRLDEEFNRRGC